jgi:tRNA threonylcarbamoyladenosine biosynthesis protein TsaE
VTYWDINSESELTQVAEHIAVHLNTGGVLLLEGEMGAGKTTFVRYLLMALDESDAVHSPTYTLCNTYGTAKRPIYHFDLYRLGDETEVANLDISSLFEQPNAITIVEWPNKLGRYTPKNAHVLNISQGKTPNQRKLTLN